ncbi:MAG: hypothetical protein HYU64_00900 [Armatimonadetes bacterium]|nr:hypothetical protein [Armatimonadota bacterium]
MQIQGQRLLDFVMSQTNESPGAVQNKVVQVRGRSLADPEVEKSLPDNLTELFQLVAERNEKHWDRIKNENLDKRIGELKGKTRDLEGEILKKSGLSLSENLGDRTISSRVTKYEEGLFTIDIPDYKEPARTQARVYVDTTPGAPGGELYISLNP